MKNKIKQYRVERKLSQAELGILVNVSRQAINAVETGKHDPSLLLAFKIAHVFNMNIEDIFDPKDKLTD